MIIINRYTDQHTKKAVYMLHYIKSNKLTRSTEKLAENVFKDVKYNLCKGHKDIILFNVPKIADLKAVPVTDIDSI